MKRIKAPDPSSNGGMFLMALVASLFLAWSVAGRIG